MIAIAERSAIMLVLHQMQMSGNCYKVRLAAHQLGIPITLKEYGLHDGTTRTPEFLAKNPNGRVPMLELEDGRLLPEIRRDHLVSRRRHGLMPDEQMGSRAGAAMDVLRAIQPRALCRGGALLAEIRAEGRN